MYPRLTFNLEGFLCLSFPSIRTTGRTTTPGSSSLLLRSHFLFCPWMKFYWNTTTHITHMICVLSMVTVPLQPTCWVPVRAYLILKIQFFLFLFFSFPFLFFLDTASGWPWTLIFLALALWALGSQVFISACGLRLKSVRHWINLLYTICLPQRWPLLNTCDVLMCTFQARPQEVSAVDTITVSHG